MSKRELRSLLSGLLPYVKGKKQATALTVVLLISLSHGAFGAPPHLHVFPPVSSHTLTVPIDYDYVSRIHSKTQDATALCTEPPHPDHDAGGVTVNPVTGEPSEDSQVQQVTFTVPVLTPLQATILTPDFRPRARVQTRALGAARNAPSKMRGRS